MEKDDKKKFNSEVIDVEDVDFSTIVNHAKNGTLDHIENELELMGGIRNVVPENMAHLSEDEFVMVMMMVSKDVFCEFTNKKTLNDVMSSFIMTFYEKDTPYGRQIKNLVNKAYKKEEIVIKKEIKSEVDINLGVVDEVKREITFKYKINSMVSYIKLKGLATSFWNDNNLKQYMKTVKDLINGGISDTERFKETVLERALDSDNPQISSKYASIHAKIEGLDKNNGTKIVNIFEHGGSQYSKQLADISGNTKLDISNIIEISPEELEDE